MRKEIHDISIYKEKRRSELRVLLLELLWMRAEESGDGLSEVQRCMVVTVNSKQRGLTSASETKAEVFRSTHKV